MKVATVLDSSVPISMVRRHSGMISVDSRKLITSVSSTWGGSMVNIGGGGVACQRRCGSGGRLGVWTDGWCGVWRDSQGDI